MAVSLLFQEVEYGRPSLKNYFEILENFFFYCLVPMYNVTSSCLHSACVVTCGGHIVNNCASAPSPLRSSCLDLGTHFRDIAANRHGQTSVCLVAFCTKLVTVHKLLSASTHLYQQFIFSPCV